MSAFLGPIHYWLYDKIKFQEGFIQSILAASEREGWDASLAEKLDAACGKADLSPLEESIDGSNIHGWLQQKIGVCEARLAFAVTELLRQDAGRLPALRQAAYDYGRAHPIAAGTGADKAFRALGDRLLDGMPCDRVNEPVELESEQALWRQTQCVHQDYWEQAGGDIAVYYALREQMINGMLADSGLTYHAGGDRMNKIVKE